MDLKLYKSMNGYLDDLGLRRLNDIYQELDPKDLDARNYLADKPLIL